MICTECNLEYTPKYRKKGTGNDFCSRSCAAKYNGRLYPKRQKEGSCKSCGCPIVSQRVYCDACLPDSGRIGFDFTKILYKDVLGKSKSDHSKTVRGYARTIYRNSEKPKKCVNCGYDKSYEVCHIKPIRSFSGETPVSEINDPDNLVALCRNCHWELDTGILTL